MIPRTPLGDLLAAFVLVAAVVGLAYVSIYDGRLGLIDREANPALFWISVVTVSLLTTGVAVLVAWEAVAAMGGG